jgi:hypothetical protein
VSELITPCVLSHSKIIWPQQAGRKEQYEIIKTASVAIVSGLVMVPAASISARAAMTGSGSVSAEVPSAVDPNPAASVEHNWLMPSAVNQRHGSMTCKPGHIFSQRDVVGDPESCIMRGAGFAAGGRGSATAAPAV